MQGKYYSSILNRRSPDSTFTELYPLVKRTRDFCVRRGATDLGDCQVVNIEVSGRKRKYACPWRPEVAVILRCIRAQALKIARDRKRRRFALIAYEQHVIQVMM
jgi:hypothetical protein